MAVPQPRHLPRCRSQETMGMFSAAPMRCPQDGQRERGTSRLKRSVWGGGSPRSSAAWFAHSRSIMIGTRWITTLRKLPTSRPITAAATVAKAGDWARRSSIVRDGGASSRVGPLSRGDARGWPDRRGMSMSRRPAARRGLAPGGFPRSAPAGASDPRARAAWGGPASSDDLAELEDRQVHGHDEPTDQGAAHHHDDRLEQARQALYRVVDLPFVDVGRLAEHRVE